MDSNRSGGTVESSKIVVRKVRYSVHRDYVHTRTTVLEQSSHVLQTSLLLT